MTRGKKMGSESDLIREGNKQQDKSSSLIQSEKGRSATDGWNSEASKSKGISAVDGKSTVYIDHRWAQDEYNKLSPEAKREVNTNVNNIFTLRNPEFASGNKLDSNNLEHRPYIEQQSRIRDELMTWQKDGKTGSEYWETEVSKNKETTSENNSLSKTADLPTGASESPATPGSEASVIPEQKRIPGEAAPVIRTTRCHWQIETRLIP